MMRRLLKFMNYAAQLMALIDIGKQISEHLASKKATNNTKKKRNRLISQRLRFLVVIPTGPVLLKCITETYVTTIYFSATYSTVEV